VLFGLVKTTLTLIGLPTLKLPAAEKKIAMS
jgi:hypothetical protein